MTSAGGHGQNSLVCVSHRSEGASSHRARSSRVYSRAYAVRYDVAILR